MKRDGNDFELGTERVLMSESDVYDIVLKTLEVDVPLAGSDDATIAINLTQAVLGLVEYFDLAWDDTGSVEKGK